jgi:hypothetical protein
MAGNNYVDIESSNGFDQEIKQSLKFKTGNFVWRVRFNTALDPRTVNNETMYVTSEGGMLKTNITYDSSNNEVQVEPLEPYAKDEEYTLHITTKVASRGRKYLKKSIEVKFKL